MATIVSFRNHKRYDSANYRPPAIRWCTRMIMLTFYVGVTAAVMLIAVLHVI